MTKSPDSSYKKIAEAAKFLKLDFSAEDMATFVKEICLAAYMANLRTLRILSNLSVRLAENAENLSHFRTLSPFRTL